jgi:hypothetical protein
MKIDLAGRVRNISLPKTKPLLPVLEAVVNSFQSLEELPPEKPQIIIEIMRHPALGELTKGMIEDFVITDNGAGFNERNFESFITSDSTHKIEKGGKGIGRFLWLKAFDRVTIESHFQDATEEWFSRALDFNINSKDFEKDTVELSKLKKNLTKVSLVNMKETYSSRIAKGLDAIAYKIVEHCLPYFMRKKSPNVLLIEGNDKIDLNKFFREQFGNESNELNFKLKGNKFSIRGFRLRSPIDRTHRLVYAADLREVESEILGRYISTLNSSARDAQGPFFYVAFIQGNYLDKHVNPDRTGFSIPESTTHEPGEDVQPELFNEPTKEEIRQNAIESIKQDLAEVLITAEETKKQRVIAYIEDVAPWYRPLLKDIQLILQQLQTDKLSDNQIEAVLHQIKSSHEQKARAEVKEIKNMTAGGNPRDYIERVTALSETLQEIDSSNLAQYVIHRKATIELLESCLSVDDTGKYNRENVIHTLIFPMKRTSSEIDYDSQNLWLIDERFNYHKFLASDKALAELSEIDNNSASRPDVIIFNKKLIYGEGEISSLASILLVEFKRPGKGNYNKKESPLDEVLRHIREIRAGGTKTNKGRPIGKNVNSPVFGYIICDAADGFTSELVNNDFKKTADGAGYYKHYENLNSYLEYIPYNKLIADATKRNKIFFEKLGITDKG